MVKILSLASVLLIPGMAFAAESTVSIPSVTYVQNIEKNMVDTSEKANQFLAGKYTVTGELHVQTPPLPSAN